MGRIKTLLVKRIARKLVKEYPQEFTQEFNNNKKLVEKYTNAVSSKMRNVIAGYTSRLVKQRTIHENEPKRKLHEEDLSRFYE